MLLVIAAAASLSSAVLLRQSLEEMAGGPVKLDVRTPVPACPSALAIQSRPGAFDVRCAESGWRLVVPVAGKAAESDVLVKRGATVIVEADGAGYRIRADGIAEQDGVAGGLVRVRNARTGERMLARLGDDGRLRLEVP